MIIDLLDNCHNYIKLHKSFGSAFNFLQKAGLREYKEGRYDIIRDDVYALVSNASGLGKAKASLEAHKKYIDIQVVLNGEDLIGSKPLAECKMEKTPYDSGKDCVFFKDKSNFWFKLYKGSFVIFFPEDAHAPLAGNSRVKKAVIKVRA